MYAPVLVVPTTDYGLSVPVVIGTNIIRICKRACSDDSAIPEEWNAAFQAVQNGFVGQVKSTNQRPLALKPLETVTLSGLARKEYHTGAAVTEPSESASSRVGICPCVVELQQSGRSQRVPVRIYNMSAKTIQIQPRTVLCELQEVKVLRHADPPIKPATTTALVHSQVTSEADSAKPDRIDLDDTDLTADKRGEWMICSRSGTMYFPRDRQILDIHHWWNTTSS